MDEGQHTPPMALLKAMGGEIVGLRQEKARALRDIGPNAIQWFEGIGEEAWTPLAIYVHMSGSQDASEIRSAVAISAEQTLQAMAADVDGMGMEVMPPGSPGSWSNNWDFLPEGMLGDEDFTCMAVDWSIALLVSTTRIVGPRDRDELDEMRRDVVAAMIEDGMDAGNDFDDLVTSAVIRLLRRDGVRMPQVDHERVTVLRRHFGSATNPDEIAEAWMAHSFVHRRMHEEIQRRYMDARIVMMLADVLFTIDLNGTTGQDGPTKHRGSLAIHAVHDALRTMLMEDVHDPYEAHVFSDTLGSRSAAELVALIEAEEPSTITLVDSLTRRAFARRTMQTLDASACIADEPHLLHKARTILGIELQDMIEVEELPAGCVEWMLALAVSTIVNSQEDENPHDPVWRTMARRLSEEDGDRSNPDPLSIEGMQAIRTGVGAIRGTMTVTGVVVHCVDPDSDEDTSEAIHRMLPESGVVVPGDVQMTRVAKVADHSCSLREAMDLVEGIREECDVHGAHLIGTLDGRSCLIDSSEGVGVEIHVGSVKRMWN